MFLKVCLFTYNVFCNAALRMFYRCNMAALKADVSFYGLDIYISLIPQHYNLTLFISS